MIQTASGTAQMWESVKNNVYLGSINVVNVLNSCHNTSISRKIRFSSNK